MATLEEQTAVLMDPACLDRVDELVSEPGVDLVGNATDPMDARGLASNRESIDVSEVKPWDKKVSGT
jgi:hypothetical protein